MSTKTEIEIEEIRVIDVIQRPSNASNFPLGFVNLILDRLPDVRYERHGDIFFSNDSGFMSCLKYVRGSKDAFAGRKFTISFKDGSTFEADGNVWNVAIPESLGGGDVYSVGASTLDELSKCYVFFGYMIHRPKLEQILKDFTPSSDYYKYDNRRTLPPKTGSGE